VFRQGWRSAAVNTLVALVVAATMLSPWAIRNQALFDRPVLVSANFGANLWMGNNPHSDGSYMPLPDGLPADEIERDSLLGKQAMTYIIANPLRYAQLSLSRLLDSFGRETVGVAWNEQGLPEFAAMPLKLVSSAYWLLMLALCIFGVCSHVVERPNRLFDPLVIAPGLFAAIAVLVVGGDRYHFGMMPFVAIYAAYAIVRGEALILSQLRGRQMRHSGNATSAKADT
jgi:hypothetical protein